MASIRPSGCASGCRFGAPARCSGSGSTRTFALFDQRPRGGAVQTPRNITSRIGRWSVQHRKAAILGWLAFVLVSLVIGMKVVPQEQIDPKAAGPGESGKAAKAIDGAYEDKASE